MDVSNNIKRIRQAVGLSQAETARRLEMDPSAYHRLENRGKKLSLEQLESIAGALGVPLLRLLTWGDEEPVINSSNDLSQDRKRIVELEDRLKDKDKIIEKLEKDFETANYAITEYLWDLINDNAITAGIGNVELTYSEPERVITVPMQAYVKSLINEDQSDIDDSYHTYGIELTDLQVKSIFHNLLKNKLFKDMVATFYRNNSIHDKTLNACYEDFITSSTIKSFKRRTR